MLRLVFPLLMLLLLVSTVIADDAPIRLEDPIGVFIDGSNDTVSTSVASLACLYMKMKGYDPVNLNDAWKGERKLHERRAIRKRAGNYGVQSFVYMNISPDDETRRYRLYSASGSKEVNDFFEKIGLSRMSRRIFRLGLDTHIYEKTSKKKPIYSGEFSGACHLSTEFNAFGVRSVVMIFDDPAIELIGAGIDSLLSIIPETGREIPEGCQQIPALVLCDESFKKQYSDLWPTAAAKQVEMANQILASGLGVVMNVQSCDTIDMGFAPKFEDLLLDVQGRASSPDAKAMIVFTGVEAASGKTSLLDVGELGRAPVVGNKIVVSNSDATESDTTAWNCLSEGMVIAHEIGHMLGAVHADNAGSIMYPMATTVAVEFDSLNVARTKTFLPLVLGQECYLSSCTYPQLIDTLAVMYPDTSDLVKALHGVLFTFGQANRLVKAGAELDDDYLYTVASGMDLLKRGVLDQARASFVQAKDLGPGYGELFYLTGLLYLAVDSVETGDRYLDKAWNAGFIFRDTRSKQTEESKSGSDEKD